jgi:hypothetical protein
MMQSFANSAASVIRSASITAILFDPTVGSSDIAIASFNSALHGITVVAWINAVDTVPVRFKNRSGGTLDLASSAPGVWVSK